MKIKKNLVISTVTLALVGNSAPHTLATESVMNEKNEVTSTCKNDAGIKSWTMGNTQVAQYSNMLFTGGAGKEFTIFEEAYYLRYHVNNGGDTTFDWKIFDPYDRKWASGRLVPGGLELGQLIAIPRIC